MKTPESGPDPAPAQDAPLQTWLQDALRALASGGMASPLAGWRGRARSRCHPRWVPRLAAIAAASGSGRPVQGAITIEEGARVIAEGYAALARRTGFRSGLQASIPLELLRRLDGGSDVVRAL